MNSVQDNFKYLRRKWHQPCETVTHSTSQSCNPCSTVVKETLDKSMIQKDSLSRDLPQDPWHSTCFQNFRIYSGSQGIYSEGPHSGCDCWHTHCTCHSHTHSRFDPPSRFWIGPVFRASSGEKQYPQKKWGVSSYLSDRIWFQLAQMALSIARGLCS